MKRRKGPTDRAVVPEPMQPTLHLEGKDARKMYGKAPGRPVKMIVHGHVSNVGQDEYGGKKTPTARITIHRIQHMSARKSRGPAGGPPAKRGY